MDMRAKIGFVQFDERFSKIWKEATRKIAKICFSFEKSIETVPAGDGSSLYETGVRCTGRRGHRPLPPTGAWVLIRMTPPKQKGRLLPSFAL